MTHKIQGIYIQHSAPVHVSEEWEKYYIQLQTTDEKNPTKTFEVLKRKTGGFITENIQKGEEVILSYNWESKEWKGKWFHNLTAWKIETVNTKADTTPTSEDNNNTTWH